jgi:2-polyprenyl-6-methoxyphenol hydroxylase-like FAD-dependent oxidoreductase
MRALGDHALILGASMGGLSAAAALSETFHKVTVVDRDVLPEIGEDRRGVPQGLHAHALLPRGAQILEELFPGFLSELEATGVPLLRDLSESHSALSGHQLCPRDHRLSFAIYQPSRAHLEHLVRTRLRALPTVDIVAGCEVVDLTTSASQNRVTGARLLHHNDGGRKQTLDADLVIDTTGRSGRTPAWLAAMGYQPPPEETVPVQLMYVSQRLRLAPDALGRLKQVLIGAVPQRPTVMALFQQENNWWTMTLGGYSGHHPPTDRPGYLEVARRIAPPDIFAAIRDAQPLSELVARRFPTSLRRRYERVSHLPAGLVVLGDAICSFNPLYGQGMTVAAMQALALRDCLAEGDANLARRFSHAASKLIDIAWQLSLSGDLTMPQVPGQLPRLARASNAYVDRVLTAAEQDPTLTEQFLRVTGLLDPPSKLLRLNVLRRAFLGARRGRAAEASGTRPNDPEPLQFR